VCKSKGSMKPGGEVKARLRRLLFGVAVGSWECAQAHFQLSAKRKFRCWADRKLMWH